MQEILSNRKALITGGEGFIGSHLTKLLSNAILYDLKSGHDVRKPIQLGDKDNIECIYNLAAIHKTPGFEDHEYFETNIKGAENVCDFARKHDVNCIVFTSSIAPYAASEELKTEQTLPMPNTPYGVSKLVAEEIHKRWQVEKPNERTLIILRPGVVFGSGEDGNYTRLYRSLKKGVFAYPGRDDTLKACIYVKDLVNAMHEMAQNYNPGIYLLNMCYEKPNTIREIVETICEVTGLNSKRMKIPTRLIYVSSRFINGMSKLIGWNIMGIHPGRITKLLISTNISGEKLKASGYKMKYSLHDAIFDWFKDNDKKELR